MVSLDGWFLSKGCLLETGCCNGDIMRIYVPFFSCREHLFFECSFTGRNWKEVMCWCMIPNPKCCWDEVVSWGLHNLKGASVRAIICKLSWNAIMYLM